MITLEMIKNEILKDESMKVKINTNYACGLKIYHNGVYTDTILIDEMNTVIFNNNQNELKLYLPIMDEIIGNLYQRINY